MPERLTIKPHHFIDIITYYGEGKKEFEPHPYGHAVHLAAEKIHNNHAIILEFEFGADDICKPCIHNIDGICDDTIDTSYRPDAPPLKRDWNLLIDQRWCERLSIDEGDKMTAQAMCRLIEERAGDITDIYREIPTDRTSERWEKLQKGIVKYCARD